MAESKARGEGRQTNREQLYRLMFISYGMKGVKTDDCRVNLGVSTSLGLEVSSSENSKSWCLWRQSCVYIRTHYTALQHPSYLAVCLTAAWRINGFKFWKVFRTVQWWPLCFYWEFGPLVSVFWVNNSPVKSAERAFWIKTRYDLTLTLTEMGWRRYSLKFWCD